MGHRGRALAVAGWSVALLALTACGPPSSPSGTASTATTASDTSTGPPPSLSAQVVQYRRDAQRGVVQVKVTNDGPGPVRVDHVALRSTTLTVEASAVKDSLVGAGLSVDLTVELPPPACPSSGGRLGTGTDEVRLRVEGATLTLPVDDAVLQQVRVRRCAEAAVGDVVGLAFEPTWVDAGEVGGAPALRGRLVAEPAEGATGTVLVGGATTLFTVEGGSTGALDGTGPVVLDVVVTVTRCDAHAVAEDKKGYLFPVQVRTDELDDVRVEVAVPVPERAPLQDLIDRTCR